MKRLLAIAVALTASFFWVSITPTHWGAPVQADHGDGNMPAQVNYWLVEDGQLRVCDSSGRVSTTVLDGAIAIWNNGIGATILLNSCTDWGSQIIDVAEDVCGNTPYGDPIACAQLPDTDSRQQRLIKVEPDAPTGNQGVMIDLIAHELGHNLGFNHYPPDSTSCNPNSIMGAVICNPPLGELKQIDKDNYHNGYHADPVSSFSGTSSSPHSVNFSWNPSNIHNEREFLINWRNNCTGQWQILATASKNSSSKTVTGLQGGFQVRW